MSVRDLSRAAIEARLAEAEALVEALKGSEVDAVVGRDEVAFVRGRRAEQRAQRFQRELERRVDERTGQLRSLALELGRSEQRERQRLAALLHDHLQQLVAAARLRLGGLRTRLAAGGGRGEDAQAAAADLELLDKTLDLLAEAMAATRSLAVQLSPPELHRSGLGAALGNLARRMGELQGLRVELDCPPAESGGGADLRALLYQALRELLFNVAKHAGVDTAAVRVERDAGRLQVEVRDAGCGFEPAAADAGGGTGLGLFGLRERLRALDGELQIDSRPGHGSRIRLSVPLGPQD